MAAPEKTTIVRRFGGRDRAFRLRIGEIGELESLCQSGIGAVYVRVATGQHKFSDLRETIRLGLIGGGAAPGEADLLVVRYFDDRPLNENAQLAADILVALHAGAQEAAEEAGTEPGKTTGESEGPATSPRSLQPVSSPA